MKLELTQKDIFLLKVAGSALILFFMLRFFFMPGLNRLQENTMQGESLDETISEMEAAIENIPVLEQAIETGLEELEEVSAPYYERMENHQVDELLTGLALKHGLFPVSLSIDGAAASIPVPYLYGTAAENIGTGAVSDSYIQTACGRLVLSGSTESLFALFEDLEENYPAVRLCSWKWSDRVYFDADWNMVEQPDISCELEIYMYDLDAVEYRPVDPEEQTGETGEEEANL